MEIGMIVQYVGDKGVLTPLLVTDVTDAETVSGLLFNGKTPTEKNNVKKESEKHSKNCWRYVPGSPNARRESRPSPQLMTHKEAKIESPAQIRHRIAQEEFEKNQANSKVVKSKNMA